MPFSQFAMKSVLSVEITRDYFFANLKSIYVAEMLGSLGYCLMRSANICFEESEFKMKRKGVA